MVIVTVSVSVKPEMIMDFIKFTKENALNSINEPGIIRFDFIQNNSDPANFLLLEVYKNHDAISAHKETSHYNKWRSAVENMMSLPRKSKIYTNIFPDDKSW